MLPWLPDDFANRVLGASSTSSLDHVNYFARVDNLRGVFQELIDRLVADGEYGVDVIGEAFIRSHNEPRRAWNMDEWNIKHAKRRASM